MLQKKKIPEMAKSATHVSEDTLAKRGKEGGNQDLKCLKILQLFFSSD